MWRRQVIGLAVRQTFCFQLLQSLFPGRLALHPSQEHPAKFAVLRQTIPAQSYTSSVPFNPHGAASVAIAGGFPRVPVEKRLESIAWRKFASSQLQNQDERLSRFKKAASCERSPSPTAVNLRPTP
jgi:hypothetical protein